MKETICSPPGDIIHFSSGIKNAMSYYFPSGLYLHYTCMRNISNVINTRAILLPNQAYIIILSSELDGTSHQIVNQAYIIILSSELDGTSHQIVLGTFHSYYYKCHLFQLVLLTELVAFSMMSIHWETYSSIMTVYVYIYDQPDILCAKEALFTMSVHHYRFISSAIRKAAELF